jgi:hypothetical protein
MIYFGSWFQRVQSKVAQPHALGQNLMGAFMKNAVLHLLANKQRKR